MAETGEEAMIGPGVSTPVPTVDPTTVLHRASV
jgi:hypothetical protein